MNKYPKYKPSDVEWIGEIPENWKITRMKFIANINTGGKDTIDRKLDGQYPFFVRSNTVERIDTYSFDGEAILTAGDGDIGKVFHYIDGKFDFHQRVYKISDFKNVYGRYLYHFIQSKFYDEVIKLSAKSTVDSLRLPMLQNFLVTIPPQPEQTAIANYLDEKTSKIDNLIEKKQKLIELLKEERTAVINQAVTCGINPNVKLKPSGIDWLGDIPEHWVLKKLRYVGLCQNGISKGANYFGTGFPFVSYGDIYSNEELSFEVNGLANSSEEDRKHYSVKENDVFFTRTSETIEEIGITSVCMNTIKDAVFSGFLIRFRPMKNILYKGFSKYYFRCQKHRNYFVKEMNLVTRASLSQNLLKNLPVLIPPFDEQLIIYEHIESETKRVDYAISKIEKEIELLSEYRTALISEAVTGKIDVRNGCVNV